MVNYYMHFMGGIKTIHKSLWFSVIFIVFWGLFLSRIPPTFAADDSPEGIIAFFSLGIQHPPGYVMNTLLGKIFTLLPAGSIMFRSALMSPFFHILTALLLYFMVSYILRNNERVYIRRVTGILASVLYLFSYDSFVQSLSVKGSIYTLQAFLTAAVFYGLVRARENYKFIYLSVFVFGLSLANHLQSSVILLPALGFCFYYNRAMLSAKRFLAAAVLFLLPAALFSYLFIRNAAGPMMVWGDVKDIKSLLWLLGRGQYSGIENAHNFGDTLNILKYFITVILPGQYPAFISFLLFPGAVLFIAVRKYEGILFAGTYLAGIMAIASVITAEPGLEFVIRPYMNFLHMIAAVFIAFISVYFVKLIRNETIMKTAAAVLLALFCLCFWRNLPDYSRYYLAYDYSGNVVKSVPEGGVLFAEGDLNICGVMYKNIFENAGVPAVSTELLWHEWYRKYITRLSAGFVKTAGQPDTGSSFLYVNPARRDCYTYANTPGAIILPAAHRGLVFEMNKHTELSFNAMKAVYAMYVFRGIGGKERYDDATLMFTVNTYQKSLIKTGNRLEASGSYAEALYFFKKAYYIRQESELAFKNGIISFNTGDRDGARFYIGEALRLNPYHAGAKSVKDNMKNSGLW